MSQSEFDDIKYFYRDFKDNNILVRNLSELQKIYMNEESKEEDKTIQKKNFQFLKQYLTLEKAELFFCRQSHFYRGRYRANIDACHDEEIRYGKI